MRFFISLFVLLGPVFSLNLAAADSDALFAQAEKNGEAFEDILRRTHAVMMAWFGEADPKTGLMPDQTLRSGKGDGRRVYRPHNAGADLQPFFVITSYFTDRAIYDGKMHELLRNEVLYTTVKDGIPGEVDLSTGQLGPASIFGAAEWCKDGAIPVTELLGRTPWFDRMLQMTDGVIKHAPVKSDFGMLPDSGAEVNGDLLQTLVRLYPMTGDERYLDFARRIADAYVKEVLPGAHGLPTHTWDFTTHTGPDALQLRDHGNEIIVGLALLHALEEDLKSDRAPVYRKAVGVMLDKVLQSANPDGMFYNKIRCSDLSPINKGIVDNWGYLYGAIYTNYMVTGEQRYRDATIKALKNLPKYKNFRWEGKNQDGYADAIESAIYLINREPVPQAMEWIDSEIKVLLAYQQKDGIVAATYPDGNWNRTALLYGFWKSQGAFVENWKAGVKLGATRDGSTLYVSLQAPAGWKGKLRLDGPRHRQVVNLKRNYVRLNEFPEWYVVEPNALYEVTDAASGQSQTRLGSELRAGIEVGSTRLIIKPRQPDGNSPQVKR